MAGAPGLGLIKALQATQAHLQVCHTLHLQLCGLPAPSNDEVMVSGVARGCHQSTVTLVLIASHQHAPAVSAVCTTGPNLAGMHARGICNRYSLAYLRSIAWACC